MQCYRNEDNENGKKKNNNNNNQLFSLPLIFTLVATRISHFLPTATKLHDSRARGRSPIAKEMW